VDVHFLLFDEIEQEVEGTLEDGNLDFVGRGHFSVVSYKFSVISRKCSIKDIRYQQSDIRRRGKKRVCRGGGRVATEDAEKTRRTFQHRGCREHREEGLRR
jgi:hypothetical protein